MLRHAGLDRQMVRSMAFKGIGPITKHVPSDTAAKQIALVSGFTRDASGPASSQVFIALTSGRLSAWRMRAAIERSAVDGRVRRSASEAIGEAVAQWKSKAQQKVS
jgi:hypothetical protein